MKRQLGHSHRVKKIMPFLFFLWSFCLIKQFRYPISYVPDIHTHTCSFNFWTVNFVYVERRDDDDGETVLQLVFVLRINRATCVLCEGECGEPQDQLRLSASEAIYVAMPDVNTTPRQDGRAVAIKSSGLDGIIRFRGRHYFQG